jgi:hypothetical protein
MKNYIRLFAYAAILSVTALSSCKKDDGKDPSKPAENNPQEQITTVILAGHNHDDHQDMAHRFSVTWEDLDGDGGNVPSIDSLILDTGIAYHVNVILIDKTKTPWDTISNEVAEEGDVHQFFYTPGASLLGKLNIEKADLDDNNLPIGLEFHMTTKVQEVPLTGSLNMILSHYDGIPKSNTPSPESDIDITFPVKIK